eukprot:7793614-Prorocentrum_lima.AAC.1
MCLVDARRRGIYSASDTLGATAATSPGTPLSVSSSPSIHVTVNQAASQSEPLGHSSSSTLNASTNQ